MFVRDFQIVDRPYDEVAGRFTTGIASLLDSGLDPARAAGEALRVKVAPRGWPAPVGETVEIHSGPVRLVGDILLVPFAWEATGKSSLFPRLDADLEVAAFGLRQTKIVLRGSYEPPAGLWGAHADQLLLHHLAESTIRAFLDGLCAGISACGASR